MTQQTSSKSGPAFAAGSAWNSKRRVLLLALMLAGVAAGTASLEYRAPVLVWNFTESVPAGLYRLQQTQPARGDILVIRPAEALSTLLLREHVLEPGRLLLKPLAASTGQIVCRTGEMVSIDGAPAARARSHAGTGVPLPAWSGCRRLSSTERVVLSDNPRSFDSRYFGPIDASQIIGVARLLVTFPPAAETQ